MTSSTESRHRFIKTESSAYGRVSRHDEPLQQRQAAFGGSLPEKRPVTQTRVTGTFFVVRCQCIGCTMPHRSTDARSSVTAGNPVVFATVQTGLAGGQPVSSMAVCGHDKEAGIP